MYLSKLLAISVSYKSVEIISTIFLVCSSSSPISMLCNSLYLIRFFINLGFFIKFLEPYTCLRIYICTLLMNISMAIIEKLQHPKILPSLNMEFLCISFFQGPSSDHIKVSSIWKKSKINLSGLIMES